MTSCHDVSKVHIQKLSILEENLTQIVSYKEGFFHNEISHVAIELSIEVRNMLLPTVILINMFNTFGKL